MFPDPPSRQVKSVRTAFSIVDVLQNRGSVTPTQLAEQLDISNSSVHNYFATLEQEGYVVNEGGRYRLGLRFLTHGIAAKSTLGIENAVREVIDDLSTDISYPTWWIAEEFGQGLFLEGAIPEGQTSTYGKVGKRSHLHTHAPGKAILAQFTDEHVRRIDDRYGLPDQTMKTTTDVDALLDELREVRNRGFVVSDGEAVLGILSLGAAFRDAERRTHAVGVFANSRDFAGTQAEEIGSQLRETTDALSNRLQGPRDDE